MHHLKHWTFDFPSFKTISSFPKLTSKSVLNFISKSKCMLVPNFEFQIFMWTWFTFASNLLHYGCLPSISIHNIYYCYFMPMACSLHLSLDFSWFASLESLSYSLAPSTFLVDNDFCTYPFFSSLKLRIRLKIKVRSITMIIALN